MARLDRVENITGLVEWYGKNTRLRELVNLVVVAGDRRKESKDLEEQAEMKKMYGLIETYKLNGQFRWISSQMDQVRNGELYRCIADTKGAFVQPAVYEAFGLTVVEAMSSGLPTFATCNGGPAEIIVHGKSGFHIDPYRMQSSPIVQSVMTQSDAVSKLSHSGRSSCDSEIQLYNVDELQSDGPSLKAAYTVGGHSFTAAAIEYVILKMKPPLQVVPAPQADRVYSS